MFAILALVSFVLAALNVSLAGLNIIAVGLAFLTLHMVIPLYPANFGRRWYRG